MSHPLASSPLIHDPASAACREPGTHAAPDGPKLRLVSRSSASTASAPPEAPLPRIPPEMLALAELMERWAEELPSFDPEAAEPWFVVLDRAFNAEMALAERLRRLPTCRLEMCAARQKVSLSLAGIRVRTKDGLAEACRAWAGRARVTGTP